MSHSPGVEFREMLQGGLGSLKGGHRHREECSDIVAVMQVFILNSVVQCHIVWWYPSFKATL